MEACLRPHAPLTVLCALCYPLRPAAQVVKEYVGKVDLLMSERHEQAATQEAQAKEVAAQEAQRNAYQTLMPLALPAPGMGGEAYYNQPQAGAFGFGGAPPGFAGNGY